jgi:leader peptidase (prepilin peptidase)/N-methyltransferase
MPPTLALAIVSAAVGLAVGSFLAALAVRIPQRKPIVMDRSACPHCGRRLRWFELIPVASWLIQKRRCRGCGAGISPLYPLMEIVSALIATAAVLWVPWPLSIFACLAGWTCLTGAALLFESRR